MDKTKYMLIFAIFILSISLASAADPGHGAAAIGNGTFESRSFVFQDNFKMGVYN